MKQSYKKSRATYNEQVVSNFTPTDFNEETKLAMHEARLISEGKISAKSFNSVEELMEDLMSDVDD